MSKVKVINMDFIYFLANASLTLRVVEFLNSRKELLVKSITVIHRLEGWIIKIDLKNQSSKQQDGDFRAFMNELGIPYKADKLLNEVFSSLEQGIPQILVMRRYQVAIVSHGLPNKKDIEEFQGQFRKGLGYCPETLA